MTRHSNSSVSICRCRASSRISQRGEHACRPLSVRREAAGRNAQGPDAAEPGCRGRCRHRPKKRTVKARPFRTSQIRSRTCGGRHMPEIILHHYPLSPYSEKIRLALGLKGVSWNSVEIPVWTPRPKLTPMTGGYRRTPILQIGAEFYCDTLHILRAVEGLSSSGVPLSKRAGGACQSHGLVDREGIVLQCGLSDDRQHARIAAGADRRTASAVPCQPRPRGSCVPSVRCICKGSTRMSHGSPRCWLTAANSFSENRLRAADLSAYHPIWFARQNGGDRSQRLDRLLPA